MVESMLRTEQTDVKKKSNSAPRILAWLAIISGLVACNHFLFATLFHINYFEWFLDNGLIFQVSNSLVAMAWNKIGIDEGLISPNPIRYADSVTKITGSLTYALGTFLRGNGENAASNASDENAMGERTVLAVLSDLFLGLPLTLVLAGILMAWMASIAPLVYFVNLVAGAPIRKFLRAPNQSIGRYKNGSLEIKTIGKSEEIPAGWNKVGIRENPVAITALFTSLVLLALKKSMALWGG